MNKYFFNPINHTNKNKPPGASVVVALVSLKKNRNKGGLDH